MKDGKWILTLDYNTIISSTEDSTVNNPPSHQPLLWKDPEYNEKTLGIWGQRETSGGT